MKLAFLLTGWLALGAIQLVGCQLLTTFNIPRWAPKDQTKLEASGDPLILTPYLKSGNDAVARKLAKVDSSHFLNVTSYSGYFTVDEEHNSNLFFWFFPAEGTDHLYEDDDYDGEDEDTDYDHMFLKKLVKRPKGNDMGRLDESKPVVLWLQGGPGVSSLFALFTENGPFFVNDDLTSIRENPWSWHKNYSIVFFDQPVGTGFSFTDEEGYCTNLTQVAKHLHKGLVQFFELFPNLRSNDFFITGESFAGKFIPAIGNEIYEQNLKSYDLKINLKGLALGNAFSDPYNMADYSDFAYQLGLIGLDGYRQMKVTETLLRANYDTPLVSKSYWDSTLFLFLKNSNYSNLYNIQQPEAMDLFVFYDFVNQQKIRKALHIGGVEFSGPDAVYAHLSEDFMSTAIHWIERLLNAGMRVMYYSGNWDFIVAYPLSENSFQKMKWRGAAAYRKAARQPFRVNGKLRGYVTKAHNFIEAAVLNAGHMVPTDQPEACLVLIDKFFKNLL